MKILTAYEPSWIDPYISCPPTGARVQALTVGAIQVSCCWPTAWEKYYVGWQAHAKIPLSIKKRLMAQYVREGM